MLQGVPTSSTVAVLTDRSWSRRQTIKGPRASCMTIETPLLKTVELRKHFPLRGGPGFLSGKDGKSVKAVDGVSLSIEEGKTLGVVGESGCGKTTLAWTMALLHPPTSGEVYFDGKRIDGGRANRNEVYRNMQIVFQDPDSSLDPQMTVGNSIGEPLRELLGEAEAQAKKSVEESLAAVGMPVGFSGRHPRQLSGGQKQRASIARAISIHPRLVILDEPTSALDASVQAQILTLLVDLQRRFHLSYLLITHNIAVAKYLSDSIAVMYAGKVVESGPTLTVLERPRHPYTLALINSAPFPDPWKRNLRKEGIKGEVPSAINPPSGCRFNPRCPYAEERCRIDEPVLEEIAPMHMTACHFVEKTADVRVGAPD